MRHINPAKAAISLGSVIGLYHLMWVTIVALGWAKSVLDFVLRLHFVQLDVPVAPFTFGTAAALVVLTFTLGGMFGLVFALMWNWLGNEPARTESAKRTTTAKAM